MAVVLALAIAGCSNSGGDADDKAAAPEKAEAEAKAGVTMDAETQQRIGLKIETPAPAQWQPEMRVYGHVLDPTPLLNAFLDLGRAQLTFDSSHQELERARQLKKDNNISERAFQDAEAAYRQNLAAMGAVRLKIQADWGKRIAGMLGPDIVPPGTERKPDAFLTSIPDSTVLIRVDLPPGGRMKSEGQTARIVSLATNAGPVTATCFDLLPVLDAQTQQQGVLFAAEQSGLAPGEAVTAYIKTAGEPVSGVLVPAGSVLRHEGRGWVYVQTQTNRFVRVEVPLDRQLEGGWFISENLSATNRIVTTGAQTVLSAELSGGEFTTGERD